MTNEEIGGMELGNRRIQTLPLFSRESAIGREPDPTPIPWTKETAPVFAPPPYERRALSDLPMCEDCRREIDDRRNRRYQYPFTSCPYCRPRQSILEQPPFRRENTTMAPFEPCSDCKKEYETPGNRRHRDEAISCPICGPALRAVTPAGEVLGSVDPIQLATRAIRAQLTIAIKGDRSFSYACDATSSLAVARLRERCGLLDGPLTVMVRDLDEASAIAHLTAKETSLLTSVERPVVLVSIRTDSPLANEVAAGNRLVGLLLPYTPLHHLLAYESGRPLVFLPAGAPDHLALRDNASAIAQLRHVADLLLLSDRAIASARGSIARATSNPDPVSVSLRSAIPALVPLRHPVEKPVLACGVAPENSICFAASDCAHLEPGFVDVEGDDPVVQLAHAIDRVRRRFGIEPEVIVHDLDTRSYGQAFALEQPAMIRVPVQHHHAHMASCLVEHGIDGPALGVVFDYAGLGSDGSIWGGEIFFGGLGDVERVATFRPVRLAGEHATSRQIWRVALALLDDAFDCEPPLHAIPLFRNIPRRGIDAVRRILDRGQPVRSHSAAQQLDAIAAIAFARADSGAKGSISSEWDAIAEPARGRYPVVIRDGVVPWEIDLRPVVKAAVTELVRGVAPSQIAAKVRNSVMASVTEILLARGAGPSLPVVFSGDYFEYTRIANELVTTLGGPGFVHASVPAGDRGLALGQALVADVIVRSGGAVAMERV